MTGALALAILLHALLGVALAALVWAAGAGCLRLLGRPTDTRSLLDAYPFGLLAATAAASLALLWPPLGVLSLAALGAGAWLGLRPLLPTAWGRVAAGALCATGFGAGLGLVLHGPTAELDSAAYGGMLWYVVKVVSATESILPFRDLLAEGETMIYAEAGTSFVGAALTPLPGFDPILYHAATLPAFGVAALLAGLALFTAGRPPLSPGALAAAAALLAVAVVPYASWVTETPPAAFAIPLAFSLWRVWRDDLAPRWLVLLGSVVALDYFLTKVLGIMALGLLVLGALVERNRHRPDFARLFALGLAALGLGAAAIAGLLFAFASWYAGLSKPKALPLDALRGLTDGDVDRNSAALALLVVGEVLLAAALVRARQWTLLGALAVTVLASWFLAGYGFDIALGSEVFVAALVLLAGVRLPSRLVLAAGGALALSVATRDVVGLRAGALLALLLLAAVASVVLPRVRAAALAAVAVGATAGILAVGGGEAAVAVTPADEDIWAEVAERVPERALVFTSLTGPEVTPHAGWNNYPAVAGRQLFIAGWYDGRLVSAPADRDRKLAQNRAVLEGTRAPGDVPLERDYSGYYAVVERDADVPPSFRRLYANDAYALYELP